MVPVHQLYVVLYVDLVAMRMRLMGGGNRDGGTGKKLTIYLLQQAMFAFVLVHAALRPSSTVGKIK